MSFIKSLVTIPLPVHKKGHLGKFLVSYLDFVRGQVSVLSPAHQQECIPHPCIVSAKTGSPGEGHGAWRDVPV